MNVTKTTVTKKTSNSIGLFLFTVSMIVIMAAITLAVPTAARAQAVSPYTGTFTGFYTVDLGGPSPSVGAISITIDPNGYMATTSTNPQTGAFSFATGTVNALGTFSATYVGSTAKVRGQLVLAPATNRLSAIYTLINGASVLPAIFAAGAVPSSPLAGTYGGTIKSNSVSTAKSNSVSTAALGLTSGASQTTLDVIIGNNATVSGTIELAGTTTAIPIIGYVDTSNKLYAVFASSATNFGVLDSILTKSGTTLSGAVQLQIGSNVPISAILTLSK